MSIWEDHVLSGLDELDRTRSREDEDREILCGLEDAVATSITPSAPPALARSPDEQQRWRRLLADTVAAAKTFEAENEVLRAKLSAVVRFATNLLL